MKFVLRIFNGIIMAVAFIACILMFATPSLSFNSNIGLDIKAISAFVPANEYTQDVDLATYLGTDEIQIGVQFQVYLGDMTNLTSGNRDLVNEKVVSKSMDDIVNTLHEPIDLITDYAIKGALKKLVKTEITRYLDQARQKYASDKSLDDIMNDVGIDDEFFTSFSLNLYNAANSDTATVDSLGDFLFNQIDETMAMADDSRAIDSSEFGEETRNDARDKMVSALSMLKLVEEDGVKVKKLSDIPYIYLSDFIVQQLNGKVDATELTKTTSETYFEYSDRLLRLYVYNVIPNEVYQGIGYFALGCIVCLCLFSFIWIFLLGWTIYKTLTSKPWTKFGVWFWIIGPLQLVLGLLLTIGGKFILPGLKLSQYGIPITKMFLVFRTFALGPSVVFLICIPLAIVYSVLRKKAKEKYQFENRG